MIDKLLIQIANSFKLQNPILNSMDFVTTLSEVVLRPNTDIYGGATDNRLNYGYIRILDETVFYSRPKGNLYNDCNYKYQQVELTVRLFLAIWNETSYRIEDRVLQTINEINIPPNVNPLGYDKKSLTLQPKLSYLTSEKAISNEIKEENGKKPRINKDLTFFAMDIDVSFVWQYDNCALIDLCIPEICVEPTP